MILLAALLVPSLLSALFGLYAADVGMAVLRRWDPSSPSAGQAALERRHLLVSAGFPVVAVWKWISPFFFVRAADGLHPRLTGAMCAAGVLNATPFGYPALIASVVGALGCGLWLTLGPADNGPPGFPLIRVRYALTLVLAPVLLSEAAFLAGFLIRFDHRIIAACCSLQFTPSSGDWFGTLSALAPIPAAFLYFGSVGLACFVCLAGIIRGKAGVPAILAGLWLPAAALAGITGFVAPYYYELPTHHCPFCLLQAPYHGVGYALYAALGAASVGIVAAGLIGFRSERAVIPYLRRSCGFGLAAGMILLALGLWPVATSNFIP